MGAYSMDLRKRVMEKVREGMNKTAICTFFKICRQTLYNWMALEKEQGHLQPQTGFQKGHSHGITDLKAFQAYVDNHPDNTQEEMGRYFGVGSSTIGRALQKIGYSRKKKPNLRRKK